MGQIRLRMDDTDQHARSPWLGGRSCQNCLAESCLRRTASLAGSRCSPVPSIQGGHRGPSYQEVVLLQRSEAAPEKNSENHGRLRNGYSRCWGAADAHGAVRSADVGEALEAHLRSSWRLPDGQQAGMVEAFGIGSAKRLVEVETWSPGPHTGRLRARSMSLSWT